MAIDTRDLLVLPIVIPKVPEPYSRNLGSEIDFNDYSLGLFKASGQSIVYEGETGTFNPDEYFKLLFPKKYNFSYWNKGEVDYSLNHLDHDGKVSLSITGKVGGLVWASPDTSLSLQGNGRGHPSSYLINLKNYVKKGWVPNSLEDLREIVNKLKELSNSVSLNPVSVPLTQSNLLLNEAGKEFWWIRSFDSEHDPKGLRAPILKAWHEAYPSRIEWNTLGTIKNLESYDQTKAYLQALSELPSMDRENIEYTIEGKNEKIPNAHPGSLYIIETTIPGSLQNGPIPVKSYWPIGHIPRSNPICKPFLDLLDFMKIPYKILWSYQIILKDMDKKPFKYAADKIWILEEKYMADLAPISMKNLHYTVTGHMLGLHYEFTMVEKAIGEGETIRTWPATNIKTTGDYNPPVACAVKAAVLCKTYRAYLEARNPIAIREDNITGRGIYVGNNGFREKDSGDYLVISPNIRDLPGEHLLKDNIVDKFRNNTHFKLKREYRNTLLGGDLHIPLGFPLGEEVSLSFGNSYFRIPKNKVALKGGDMGKENTYIAPTYHQIETGEVKSGKWISSDWFENWVLGNTRS